MDDELKKIMEENLRLTRETNEMVHKIKAYINFQKVMSLIYFLLIVVPIILGIIYLPPLLGTMIKQYQGLMGTVPTGSIQDLLKDSGLNLDTTNLSPEIQKMLNKK